MTSIVTFPAEALRDFLSIPKIRNSGQHRELGFGYRHLCTYKHTHAHRYTSAHMHKSTHIHKAQELASGECQRTSMVSSCGP